MSMDPSTPSHASPKTVRVNYKGRVIQYCEESLLGKGAYGVVYRGWDDVSLANYTLYKIVKLLVVRS